MAIPQGLLTLLQSIQIVQLPSQALPGDVIKPVLNVDLNTVFDPLTQAEELAHLALQVVLDDIQLAANLVLDNVQLTLKAVLDDLKLPLNADNVQIPLNLTLNNLGLPLKVDNTQLPLQVSLDNIQLAPKAGNNDLEIILKDVEFATPVDGVQASGLNTNEPANDKLPYTIPTSVGGTIVPELGQLVEGLLGKLANNVITEGSIAGSVDSNGQISGTIGNTAPGVIAGTASNSAPLTANITSTAGSIAGSVSNTAGSIAGSLATTAGAILGNITGDITKPAVLDPGFTTPTVSWRIQDSRGNVLTEGNQFVAQVGTLATAAPIFAFLPQFVELSNSATLVSQVSVFADLSFVDVNGQPFNFSVGPATLDIVQAQIPTVVVMAQNPLGPSFPGLTMVAVPASSAIQALTAIAGPLRAVQSIMTNVAALAGVIALSPADTALVGIFGGSSGMIGSLLAALSSVIDPNAFIIADQIMDYSAVEVSSSGCGLGGWFACHMNDRTSAILLVGPPGRSISCFNRYNLWVGTGAFTLSIGTEAAALLGNLTVSPPAGAAAGAVFAATPAPAAPPGIPLSAVTIITPASGGTTFDNVISSMQFNPV
ncbi:MAG TPA: hypothetical protein VNX26_05115 [Candidatus Acidoferrum sp.]|nr:hypothetical protein [Candidatus Acidoferrum sp.]